MEDERTCNQTELLPDGVTRFASLEHTPRRWRVMEISMHRRVTGKTLDGEGGLLEKR